MASVKWPSGSRVSAIIKLSCLEGKLIIALSILVLLVVVVDLNL